MIYSLENNRKIFLFFDQIKGITTKNKQKSRKNYEENKNNKTLSRYYYCYYYFVGKRKEKN